MTYGAIRRIIGIPDTIALPEEKTGMNVRERMSTGRLYFCDDAELAREQEAQLEILYDFNQTRPGE